MEPVRVTVPGRRCRLPGDDLGQGGLAGTVAADEADPVAVADAEGGAGHEKSGACAELDVGDGDHARQGGRQAEVGAGYSMVVTSRRSTFSADVDPSSRSGRARPVRRRGPGGRRRP